MVSKIEPDFWLEPVKVMEINGAEITLSPVHTCCIEENNGEGLAVRFPRFTGRWRQDKRPEQATQSREILELFQMGKNPQSR